MVIPSSPNAKKTLEAILQSSCEEQLFGAFMGDLPSSPLSREVWRAGLFTDSSSFAAIIDSIFSPPFFVWKSGYYQMQMKKFSSKLLNFYVQVQKPLNEERAMCNWDGLNIISLLPQLHYFIQHQMPLGRVWDDFSENNRKQKREVNPLMNGLCMKPFSSDIVCLF